MKLMLGRNMHGFVILASCLLAIGKLSAADNQILDADLQEELFKTYESRGSDYEPRTEHFKSDGTPAYINRLIKEDSPYLLQHAHNPVNWYPWGSEAFEEARKQNKPVFLSIGYATCHWCHVMERESFEDEDIAAQMNDHFITIKVDREQLPDVDANYMLGLQVTTGSGGWPLSAFIQPDGKLFHAATYMPPDIFSQAMTQVNTIWNTDRARIKDYADTLADALAENTNLKGEVKRVGEVEIENARENILLGHDSFQGGFGPAPKFPRESSLFFLLDLAQRNNDKKALEALDFTLVRMSAGGIHDQVGGGFHRYTVDDDWLTPHFEKMLYTQASLLQIYAQTFALTGRQEHARTARRIADYVIRDMTAPNGGFYSATDADSDGGEGLYFIWEREELLNMLTQSFSKEDAELALEVWGVTEEGNFEHQNILRMEDSLKHVAGFYDELDEAALADKLSAFSATLLEHRNKRVPPLTDRKIITEWNAMMSRALLVAGRTLNEPRYTEAAVNAIEFLLEHNLKSDGTLWRAQFEGRSSTPASQADYAYLAQALIKLYDETGSEEALQKAIKLVDVMNKTFSDEDNRAYYMGEETSAGAALPSRPIAIFDNAAPTGNAVALKVLVQLWHRTGDDQYQKRAENLVAAFSKWLSQDGSGFGYFLTGTSDLLNGEIGVNRYAARGKVKASVSATDSSNVVVSIDIAQGWHINSSQPLQDYLIPTGLTLAESKPMQDVSFPDAVNRKLGFQRSELSLYEGSVQLTGVLPEVDSAPYTEIELQLQACDDEICLAPETLSFKVPTVKAELSY